MPFHTLTEATEPSHLPVFNKPSIQATSGHYTLMNIKLKQLFVNVKNYLLAFYYWHLAAYFDSIKKKKINRWGRHFISIQRRTVIKIASLNGLVKFVLNVAEVSVNLLCSINMQSFELRGITSKVRWSISTRRTLLSSYAKLSCQAVLEVDKMFLVDAGNPSN